MKKSKMYDVFIVLSRLTAQVKIAFCVCPAGLSGCCNHVTATLYYIEEYFRLGMDEEDKKRLHRETSSMDSAKEQES